jgi:hypothetical protein
LVLVVEHLEVQVYLVVVVLIRYLPALLLTVVPVVELQSLDLRGTHLYGKVDLLVVVEQTLPAVEAVLDKAMLLIQPHMDFMVGLVTTYQVQTIMEVVVVELVDMVLMVQQGKEGTVVLLQPQTLQERC